MGPTFRYQFLLGAFPENRKKIWVNQKIVVVVVVVVFFFSFRQSLEMGTFSAKMTLTNGYAVVFESLAAHPRPKQI